MAEGQGGEVKVVAEVGEGGDTGGGEASTSVTMVTEVSMVEVKVVAEVGDRGDTGGGEASTSITMVTEVRMINSNGNRLKCYD